MTVSNITALLFAIVVFSIEIIDRAEKNRVQRLFDSLEEEAA